MARVQIDALQKCEMAAEGGQSEALYSLGLIYATGKGVDVDYVTAHKWFNLAAMRGNHAARDCRTEIARDMSPDQIADAQRQAREWLSQH
ncbi:Sel1 domain-containing protein [Tepidicaulis marinus]|uniref:Sel1 domain-containing protein n=1 Tax=Tepidicaulis marinus TaxID=1333998 RepID=A0A081B811_9HYPH|nr:SEL1-like repeat protein [Tepidicaulis marinus]GAK44179.1 Sel1 domain-containing protein [Tepidicaulis marinus]